VFLITKFCLNQVLVNETTLYLTEVHWQSYKGFYQNLSVLENVKSEALWLYTSMKMGLDICLKREGLIEGGKTPPPHWNPEADVEEIIKLIRLVERSVLYLCPFCCCVNKLQ